MKQKDVVIAIVIRDGKVLICQRKENDSFGGYWEFPGGKREAGETAEQCFARELEEELALVVIPIRAFAPIEHDYGAIRVRLLPFLCSAGPGQPTPIACQRLQWVSPGELRNFQFPSANAGLIEQIIRNEAEIHAGPHDI